jgi:ribosome-binding factor A
MAQGARPERVGEELRHVLAELLAREVHDPGLGFVTITKVRVTADLQLARVSYTCLGDDKVRQDTARALGRATPFLRRAIGQRLRLRRVPELTFHFDASIENQANIERILLELEEERKTRQAASDSTGSERAEGSEDTNATDADGTHSSNPPNRKDPS